MRHVGEVGGILAPIRSEDEKVLIAAVAPGPAADDLESPPWRSFSHRSTACVQTSSNSISDRSKDESTRTEDGLDPFRLVALALRPWESLGVDHLLDVVLGGTIP